MVDLTGDDLPETVMNVKTYAGVAINQIADDTIELVERLNNRTATPEDYDAYKALVTTNYLDGTITADQYHQALGAATIRYRQSRNARQRPAP